MDEYIRLIEQKADYIVEVSPIHIETSINSKSFEDARSAAFFAMGKAIKTKKLVILILPGVFLSSTYTAITEAWFQKANVLVIGLFDKVSEVKTFWMDRCVVESLTAAIDEEKTIKNFLNRSFGFWGPSLLNIVDVPSIRTIQDYSMVLDYLQANISDEEKIYCFNSDDSSIVNISPEYKYGVLSRYIGMSCVKKVGYLLCTSECVMVDVNIFRTRYANSNMKIIVVDDGILRKDIPQWITSNGWECKRVYSMDTECIQWFVHNTNPTVIILKEG